MYKLSASIKIYCIFRHIHAFIQVLLQNTQYKKLSSKFSYSIIIILTQMYATIRHFDLGNASILQCLTMVLVIGQHVDYCCYLSKPTLHLKANDDL